MSFYLTKEFEAKPARGLALGSYVYADYKLDFLSKVGPGMQFFAKLYCILVTSFEKNVFPNFI